MKINHFTVIPATVRYDSHLSDKAKLLYGEISASSDIYSIAEDNNAYYARMFRVDARTITRCLGQLIDNGHITRLVEKGKRKLRVVHRQLPLPQTVGLEIVKEVDRDGIQEFSAKILALWEHDLDTEVADKEAYFPIFRDRLQICTQEEILRAVKNRIMFLKRSPWHSDPKNKNHANDINLLISSDEELIKYIDMK